MRSRFAVVFHLVLLVMIPVLATADLGSPSVSVAASGSVAAVSPPGEAEGVGANGRSSFPGAPSPEKPEPLIALDGKTVDVGFYMVSGGKLDLPTTSIVLDFYMWINWRGPGEPSFEFMNCKQFTIVNKTVKNPYPKSDISHIVYRIQGNFEQVMDLTDYPFSNFVINVILEDTEYKADERVYVYNNSRTGFDPAFQITGWEIFKHEITADIHTYDCNFGSPLLCEKIMKDPYSQVKLSMHIRRNKLLIFIKVVMPALLFIFVALLGTPLPFDQISQKISLCVAALFSSVAYHLSLSQTVPPLGYLTFIDKMMLGNYTLIFMNLLFIVITFVGNKKGWIRLEKTFQFFHRYFVPVSMVLIYVGLLLSVKR